MSEEQNKTQFPKDNEKRPSDRIGESKTDIDSIRKGGEIPPKPPKKENS